MVLCLVVTMLPSISLLALSNSRQQLGAVNDFPHVVMSKASANSETAISNPAINSDVINDNSSDLPEPPAITDQPVTPQELWIKAINPGYTVDGVREVGELIELYRYPSTTDSLISLAGYSLRYTNASGKSSILYEFPEGSKMSGENLLMRLTRSPESALSDVTYSTTLAMSAGPLELLYQDKVVDSVCWTGKGNCQAVFKSDAPTTLVRDSSNSEFTHLADYRPHFDLDHKSIILPPVVDDSENKKQPLESGTPHCIGLEFSEIYAYYAKEKSEQFIELYNSTDDTITLEGCTLQYKKKRYDLSGNITPNGYFAYYPNGKFTLTKNPNTSNIIELFDEDDSKVDIMEYYHGQKKATAYARFYDASGAENWNSTFAPSPNSENIFQEFRNCPAGKVINPESGNCVKASSTISSLKECPAGQYRSPITNRCRKISSDDSSPKPCAAGYERNPETNRCRKIKQPNEGADYALVPSTRSSKSTFIAFGIIVLLILAGIIYVILQFRREIVRALRKLRQRLYRIYQNLVARCTRFHRHKKP